jgi:hypothetical protein
VVRMSDLAWLIFGLIAALVVFIYLADLAD